MTNPFTEVDYLEEGRSRYTQQFLDKPVYDAYLKIILDYLNDVQSVFKDLMQLRSLDTAMGSQLDLIGNIVGQSRTLVNYNALPYFGFDGASGAETFGSNSDASVGGVFRSNSQVEGTSAVVDDETYRFLIKARIAANTTRATPEDVISGLNFITGNANCTVVEEPNAHLLLEVQNNLTDFQAYFLKGLSEQGSIVPIPIGVAVDYVFFEEDYFGFYEDPNATGFTELVGTNSGYGLVYGENYGLAETQQIDMNQGGYIANLV